MFCNFVVFSEDATDIRYVQSKWHVFPVNRRARVCFRAVPNYANKFDSPRVLFPLLSNDTAIGEIGF